MTNFTPSSKVQWPEFRGERPYVVVTPSGTKLGGFFTVNLAVELAKKGSHRLVLYRNSGMWKIHGQYVKGVKIHVESFAGAGSPSTRPKNLPAT